jgi:chromosome partitioning protein
MVQIISVINHKGGVGKTTSTANIGAGLNQLKRRVLMVDLDPQANLTRHFGVSKDAEKSIYGALTGEYSLPILPVKTGLDLVPAHQNLVGWEKEISDEPGRELFLREVLVPVVKDYDNVIIDCPPSLNLLPLNALSTSHSVLITVEPGLFAIDGMGNIFNAVQKVKNRINDDLTGCRILITRFHSSKSLHKQAEEVIRQTYGNMVFKTVIRTNVALEEAVMRGCDVFDYDGRSNGAKDYKSVCNEILKLEQW